MSKVTIYFWPRGQVMAFDEHDEQIPAIQAQSWVRLYLEWLETQGYDKAGIEWQVMGDWNSAPIREVRDGQ